MSKKSAQLQYQENMARALPAKIDRDFHSVADVGEVHILRSLLLQGVKVNVKDHEERAALHRSAAGGHIDAVKFLISNGADIHARDREGVTALHFAAIYGRIEVIDHLLFCGANINEQNNALQTVVFSAVSRGQLDTIKYLVSLGADITIKDKNGTSTLAGAAMGGHTESIKYLLFLDRELLNSKSSPEGATALHAAALNEHLESMAFLLLQPDLDINIRNNLLGQTPFDLVKETKNIEAEKLFLERFIRDSFKDIGRKGYVEVEKLIKRAISIEVDEWDGKTFALVEAIRKYEIKNKQLYTNDLSTIDGLRIVLSGYVSKTITKDVVKKFAPLVAILENLEVDFKSPTEMLAIARIQISNTLESEVTEVMLFFDGIFSSINRIETKKNKLSKDTQTHLKEISELCEKIYEAQEEGIIIGSVSKFKKKIITLNAQLERAKLLPVDSHGIIEITASSTGESLLSMEEVPEKFNGICDSDNLRTYAQHYKKNPNHKFCKSVQEAINYSQVAISRNSKESAAKKLNKELKILDETVYAKSEQLLAIKFAKNQNVPSHFIIKYLKESTEPLHKEIAVAIAANVDMSTVYTTDTKGTSLDGAFAMKIANEGLDEEHLQEDDRGLGDLNEFPSFEENEEDEEDNGLGTASVAAAGAGGTRTMDSPEMFSSDNLALLRKLFNTKTKIQTVTKIRIEDITGLISELGEKNFEIIDTSLGFKIKSNITGKMISTHRPHTNGFSGGYLDIQFIKKFIKMLERAGIDRYFATGKFEEDFFIKHETEGLLEQTNDLEKDWQEAHEYDGISPVIEEQLDDLVSSTGMSAKTSDEL